MATKLLLALALRDIAQHGCRGGQLLQADEATIATLQADGSVDPHKDAVAAARKAGATVVKVAPPPDPQALAELHAAQARVAHLEGLLQVAREAERDGLAAQLQRAREELAAQQPAG